MVGPSGKVVGIDRFQELVDRTKNNIEADFGRSIDEIPQLVLTHADGWKGYPPCAPYDAIHVGAAASDIPRPLLDQLKPGGRLIIPVGTDDQALIMITKQDDGEFVHRLVCGVRYVPLVPGLHH